MCVLLRFWLKWEFSPNTRISQRFLAQKANFLYWKQPKYISTSIAMWPLSKWKKKSVALRTFHWQKQVILRVYAKSKMTYGTSPAHEATRTAGQEYYRINDGQVTFLEKTKVLEVELEQLFFFIMGPLGKFSPTFQKQIWKGFRQEKSSKMLLLMF